MMIRNEGWVIVRHAVRHARVFPQNAICNRHRGYEDDPLSSDVGW
jgi:hypothetical protein